jgi:competence protein ComEC
MNALVPAGFLAILTGWRWVASLAGWLLTASARIAEWHAQLEPSWRVPDPPAWLALAFSAALIVTVPCLRHRIARWPALAALLALFALLLWQPWPARIDPGLLELTAIDVGQGDSLLVVFPTGSTMLVDGGGLLTYGRVRRTNFDIGEDVVSPYLWSRGIRRIDVAVATHAHQDHVGGLAALLANFRPRELWTGANPPPELIERAASLGVRAIERRAGPPFDFAGTRIEVLAPTQDYAAIKPGNNDSLAFRIAYRDRSFLLTGDLERPVEARLLAFGSLTHADVLKVGHHGSKTSTIQPFLDTVAPSMAVISAGYENSFGHPSAEVLDRLAARHTAILRTDLDGAATIRTDGVRLQYEVQRWRGISHSFERTGRGGFRPDE